VTLPDEVGRPDWAPPPDGGGPDDSCVGDPDPTAGLGEMLGVGWFSLWCRRAAEEDGTGEEGPEEDGADEDGTKAGALDAELDVGAPGAVVGGVGPLVHWVVALVVETVFLTLGVLPEFRLLCDGPGVAGPVVAGLDAGVVGLCAGEETGLCAGEDAGLDCGLLGGTVCGMLALGVSGLGADVHKMVGDGLVRFAGPVPAAAPDPGPDPLLLLLPLLLLGCPLTEGPPAPPGADPGGDPEVEPIVTIACRTPGTARAVPLNMRTAATASTGLSHTVPSR
jgi:hypothetical protein